MSNHLFSGTGVALITPFNTKGQVDLKALDKLVQHTAPHTDMLVVLGTTGESVTLKNEERRAVVSQVVASNNERCKVVLGMGGNNTADLIRNISEYDFEGIDALLSVSPSYNKPQQKGIFAHFSAIAQVSPLPIILYNVPSRTASNISAETTLALAHEFKNIVAIKEASGNFDQCMQIIAHKPDHFCLLSGDDVSTLPLLALGAQGVISVVANAYPDAFAAITNLFLNGNVKKAQQFHYLLLDIMNAQFEQGNPAGIKYLLSKIGICENVLRLPLTPIEPQLEHKITLMNEVIQHAMTAQKN